MERPLRTENVLAPADVAKELLVGYFVWLLSFITAAIAFAIRVLGWPRAE